MLPVLVAEGFGAGAASAAGATMKRQRAIRRFIGSSSMGERARRVTQSNLVKRGGLGYSQSHGTLVEGAALHQLRRNARQEAAVRRLRDDRLSDVHRRHRPRHLQDLQAGGGPETGLMDLAHRVKPGARVSLSAIPTDSTGPFSGKDDPRVKERLESDLARLADLGARLYAEKKQSLLVVLQAMDTAGKDGVLKHVVGPLDSRGLHVWSFGAPSEEERAHDFLWRFHFKAPRQGEMAFFNRSYYEDVLVVRVMNLEPRSVWKQRYQAIRDFERMLADRGTRVIKFYLHISKGEQRRRLQERIDVPDKRWKLDPRDFEARKH